MIIKKSEKTHIFVDFVSIDFNHFQFIDVKFCAEIKGVKILKMS